MTSIFRSRQNFRLASRLEEFALGRWLRSRASRNMANGHAPMALFAFDYIGQEICLKGTFELEELRAMFEFLAPLKDIFASGAALDIGANIGNHSVFFAPLFDSVLAFEPNPRTYSLLQANASLADNIKTLNVGLGSKRETLVLQFYIKNVGEASLASQVGERSDLRAVTASIERLDDLDENPANIVFVKIDVEGHEPQVIDGATETLKRWMPVIAFEQNLSAFEGGRSDTVDRLKALGYKFVIPRKRWVASNAAAAVTGTVLKIFHGTQFEFMVADTVDPGQYSLILAVTDGHLEHLATR